MLRTRVKCGGGVSEDPPLMEQLSASARERASDEPDPTSRRQLNGLTRYPRRSEPIMEAILHKASTNLNSFGTLYVSLFFRHKYPARKNVPPVRIPTINTTKFQECKTKVNTHWTAINPTPTTNNSNFSFASISAAIAIAAHLIAKCLYPGENADATPKME